MFGSGLGDRCREALNPCGDSRRRTRVVASAWAAVPVLQPWLEPSPPVGWGSDALSPLRYSELRVGTRVVPLTSSGATTRRGGQQGPEREARKRGRRSARRNCPTSNGRCP